jgi:MYXO-CTERM domain-containing protein
MRRTELPLSLGLCLAALLPTGVARAYCRTSSCMTGGAHSAAVCDPATADDCGTPIAWPQSCVEFSVQQNASKYFTLAQTETVVTTAFSAWMNAACPGGGTPRILVVEGPPAVCDQIQYNQMDGNTNAILYRDESWPYDTGGGGVDTLALTTVTYELDTGAIYDADMEINTADNDFTLGNTGVDFDLLSIVTHETGHFLGMAHTRDPGATMWPSYSAGSTSLRTPSPDDVAGICAIYPPGGSICDCDPTPRHGFSVQCAAQQSGDGAKLSAVCQNTTTTTAVSTGSSCSVAAVAESPTSGRSAAALAALGAVLLAARRKRRG